MKVLIISPFENQKTGRGDRNLRLRNLLLERGHDVTFLTSNFDHARKDFIQLTTEDNRNGTLFITVPAYHKNVSVLRQVSHVVFATKGWLKLRKRKWDIIFVSSIPPENLVLAFLLNSKKVVIDVRDIWPDALMAYDKTNANLLKTAAFKFFEWYCNFIYHQTIKRASHIFLVANGYRKWIYKYCVRGKIKINFMPLGFNKDDFTNPKDTSNEYDYCYAGGLTPQFDLLEFIEELKDKNGVFVGSGPSEKELRSNYPRAKFTGVLTRSDALAYMQNSRSLLFPSNSFAQLPNKCFDYFAIGAPVVLGRNCSREARYLLQLRQRKDNLQNETWAEYKSIEKNEINKRMVTRLEKIIDCDSLH